MKILGYKDGVKPEKLDPAAQANMERCANFLVRMMEKYGKEVLAEIEAEEKKTEAETSRADKCDK